jgi:MoaA/NifB/PqqE/SkfB family radical SAM enzyme
MDTAQLKRRARAWRNVAASATMARVDPQWVPRPHAGHIILTYKCNLKCGGCPSWQVKNHNDLTAEEYRKLFRQLTSLDMVKVLGGEPFVRRDIVSILSDVRDIIDPYVMQLTTNGMLTDRTIAGIKAVAWPGLQLRISVDGLEDTHDRMRGVEGGWKKVTRTVAAVAELKEQYGFKFGINFAITDESLNEVDAMLEFAQSMGADLIPGVNVDPFLVGTKPPEVQQQQVIMLTEKQRALDVMTQAQIGTRDQLPGIDRLLGRWFTKSTYRQHLENEVHEFPCRELKDLLYLLPNGDVVRCGMDHEPIGNVRDQSFDEIWFGTNIEKYRQKVDDCPGCMQSSVQILSRIYGGCLTA